MAQRSSVADHFASAWIVVLDSAKARAQSSEVTAARNCWITDASVASLADQAAPPVSPPALPDDGWFGVLRCEVGKVAFGLAPTEMELEAIDTFDAISQNSTAARISGRR